MGSRMLAAGLIYVQIVFGSLVRHTYSSVGPRAHVLVAFCVAIVVAWLTREAWDRDRSEKRLRASVAVLAALTAAQILLGTEAWMLRYTGAGLTTQSVVPTAHVFVGYLMLAASVVVSLKAFRLAHVPALAAAPRGGTIGGRGMSSPDIPLSWRGPFLASRLADYVELTKPRVLLLVLLTVGAGAYSGAGRAGGGTGRSRNLRHRSCRGWGKRTQSAHGAAQ